MAAVTLDPAYRELVNLLKDGPLSVQKIAKALDDSDKGVLDACNLLGRRGYIERISGMGRSGIWRLSEYGRGYVRIAP